MIFAKSQTLRKKFYYIKLQNGITTSPYTQHLL